MKDARGFTLIELLVAIVLTTTAILPLLFSLTGNYEVNVRMMRRSAADLVSIAAIQGFQNMYFRNIDNLVTASEYGYIELNRTTCDTLRVLPFPSVGEDDVVYLGNQAVCQELFNMEVINNTFDETEFIVFIYPLRMTTAAKNALLATITIDEVRKEMEKIDEGDETVQIYNITVWIHYGSKDVDTIVRTGILSPEWVSDEDGT